MNNKTPPVPSPEAGKAALTSLLKDRSLLLALKALHQNLGDVFTLKFPGFEAVVVAGPEANRLALVENRDRLLWRNETDPVVHLFRYGVLVEDGKMHDDLRRLLLPPMQKPRFPEYAPSIVKWTDKITDRWAGDQPVDLLPEMRRIALLIFMDTLCGVDISKDLDQIFPLIIKALSYISPGLWLVWKKAPRPGYKRYLKELDQYLFALISERRVNPTGNGDLLSRMLAEPGMSDDLIRDQLLTLLIAGHDTSTALLAWTLYLLGSHQDVQSYIRSQVDVVCNKELPNVEHLSKLDTLTAVVQETLRLYPPIHVGNRITADDMEIGGYMVKAGTRLMISFFLTHHDPRLWPDPECFNPSRFTGDAKQAPYTYVPFGGGPRLCIGAAYAQMEVKLVLARLLQKFTFSEPLRPVGIAMKATLEPRPGVWVNIKLRP